MGRITASRKQLVGDPKFGSLLASKFINVLMWDGKKSTAQSVFYTALDLVGERINEPEPIEIFDTAINPMLRCGVSAWVELLIRCRCRSVAFASSHLQFVGY